MGFHTFDAESAARLEDAAERYRYCSCEELLGALALAGDETVADLGSGTGFYADDVAPHVARLHAVDVQAAMHEFYCEKGLPGNVSLATADVADLPFATDALDAAYATMTFHEFASDASLAELARVCRDGARLVVVDWSAAGDGESGPPVTERYDAADADAMLADAGFTVERTVERVETFVAVAER
ncbi:methyltransferase domain-containing protein (plasmid) [Halarchaeum sp. CBA1220]|uniref:class I SAM-dependent methyltransferase n=1 Tax=Halarchaeum sp. CBA1220 TaxID=1853682 RepID=UPI000F3A8DDE|nr:methyltransferase domain-containing protein [Halarchaeum sp. CBA1220]QLC34884.1 methyltransferase domain-containing protein [Halarchaeum sp. CBA1220]